MWKFMPIFIVTAALLFAGDGCRENNPRTQWLEQFTKEQKDICSKEAMRLLGKIAQVPEAPPSTNYIDKAQDDCLKVVDRPPAYHLMMFTKGEGSDVAAQELMAGLKDTFYLLDVCREVGFERLMPLKKNNPQAQYQCRVRCTADAAGAVTCESTAYRSTF